MSSASVVVSLKCPITHDTLVDPVLVQCCSQTFSRQPLVEWLERDGTCPLCRTPLPDMNTAFLPNRAVQTMLEEELLSQQQQQQQVKKQEEEWTCRLVPSSIVYSKHHGRNRRLLGELEITKNNINKTTNTPQQPILVILVLDCSGSMHTDPIVQIQRAVKYIYNAIAKRIAVSVHVECVLFTDTTKRFTFGKDAIDVILKHIEADGGTSFSAAFSAVKDILHQYRDNNVTDALVIFMTDGEDSFDENAIVKSLQFWDKPLTVHTVGFGSNCKHNVLLQMRSVSKNFDPEHPPLPCFVANNEDADTLSSKIAGLFQHIVSQTTSIPIKLSLMDSMDTTTASFITFHQGQNQQQKISSTYSSTYSSSNSFLETKTIELEMEVDTNSIAYCWVVFDDCYSSSSSSDQSQPPSCMQVRIDVLSKDRLDHVDHEDEEEEEEHSETRAILVPITLLENVKPITQRAVAQRWYAQQIPHIAKKILALVSISQNINPQEHQEQLQLQWMAVELECALIEQQIESLLYVLDRQSYRQVRQQLEQLKTQLDCVKAHKKINLHVLNDLEHAWFLSNNIPGNDDPSASHSNTASVPRQGLAHHARNNSTTSQQQRNTNSTSNAPLLSLCSSSNAAQKAIKPFKERRPHYHSTYNAEDHSKQRTVLMNQILQSKSVAPGGVIASNVLAQLSIDPTNAHVQDSDGNTALMLASYLGYSSIVEHLLKTCTPAQLDIHHVNHDNETALTLAIKRRGFVVTTRLLLEYGATLTRERMASIREYLVEERISRYTPGKQYSFTKTLDELETFFESASFRNLTEDELCSDHSAALIRRVLLLAQKEKQKLKSKEEKDDHSSTLSEQEYTTTMHVLKLCMEKKDLHDIAFEVISKHKDHIRLSVDMIAPWCRDDTFAVFEMFLPFVNVCDVDEMGQTLLFRACENGCRRAIPLCLLNNNTTQAMQIVNQPNSQGATPLFVACAKRYPCIVDELLTHHADPNVANVHGNRPLSLVAQLGPAKIAQALVSANADPNFINVRGETLYTIAVRNRQTEVLQVLLPYAQFSMVDRPAMIDGFNALFSAVESNVPDACRMLIEYGLDCNAHVAPDNEILHGGTCLHMAVLYNCLDAANVLLQEYQHQVDINAIDVNGMTALHLAVVQQRPEFIELLKHAGADISIQDKSGNTARAYANHKTETCFTSALETAYAKWFGVLSGNNTMTMRPSDQRSDVQPLAPRERMIVNDLQHACRLFVNVLERYTSGIPGCLTNKEILQVPKSATLCKIEDSTVLIQAILLQHCGGPFRNLMSLAMTLSFDDNDDEEEEKLEKMSKPKHKKKSANTNGSSSSTGRRIVNGLSAIDWAIWLELPALIELVPVEKRKCRLERCVWLTPCFHPFEKRWRGRNLRWPPSMSPTATATTTTTTTTTVTTSSSLTLWSSSERNERVQPQQQPIIMDGGKSEYIFKIIVLEFLNRLPGHLTNTFSEDVWQAFPIIPDALLTLCSVAHASTLSGRYEMLLSPEQQASVQLVSTLFPTISSSSSNTCLPEIWVGLNEYLACENNTNNNNSNWHELFAVHSEIELPFDLFGSTLWTFVLQHQCPALFGDDKKQNLSSSSSSSSSSSNTTTKNNKPHGLVFLIRSKSARLISSLTHIPSHVWIPQKTRFRIAAWYSPMDETIFAQPNIRPTTHAFRQTETNRVVIELHEIE